MNYEQMGRACLIPGMQHMIDLMQRELDAMRAQLALAQNGGNALDAVREAKKKRKSPTGGWWANKTPEERSAEMARRYLKRKDRPPTGRPAQGGDHYGKVSAGQKGYWAKMTAEERKAEVARRTEVRNKKWAEEANLEKLHPRDPRSPKHGAWLKKMSRVMKASHKARANAVPAVKMQHLNGEAVA